MKKFVVVKMGDQEVEKCVSQLSCEKVCGGENGGSGGGKVCKPILVIRLESRPKLINNKTIIYISSKLQANPR